MTCVVAIDGPAGAGKSTVARAVAARLGVTYLDTGAMYRAVTWLGLRRRADLDDEAAIAALAALPIAVEGDTDRLLIGGEDATPHLRDSDVTEAVSRVARHPSVRAALVGQQRDWLATHDGVAEGRDIGEVVAPDAAVKVFLTASPDERVRRRGGSAAAVLDRDARDHRTTPLQPAPGAVVVDSSGLTVDEVVDRIVGLVGRR
jgi:cytidylate kinase